MTALIAWLVVGPRLELVSIGGSSVRLEDLVLLLLAVTALPALAVSSNRATAWAFVVGAVACLAALVAAMSGRVDLLTGTLYALRPFEYWVVFAGAFHVASMPANDFPLRLSRLVRVIVATQVSFAALQVLLGVQVGFSKFSLARGAGLTAGPYELGAICVIAFVYLAVEGRGLWAGVAVAGVMLSASRISMVALAVCAVYLFGSGEPRRARLPRARRRIPGLPIVGLCLAAALLVVGGFADRAVSQMAQRIGATSLTSSWESGASAARDVSVPESAAAYSELAYREIESVRGMGGADASNDVRFFRWNLLLRALREDGSIAIGLGPSFAGPSVDGAMLRIVAETGLAGLVAWTMLFGTMFKRCGRVGRGALLGTLVGSLVIDLPYSMRVVTMLLAVAAADIAASSNEMRPSAHS